MTSANDINLPTLAETEAAASRLAPYIVETPAVRWSGATARELFGANTEIWLKLELFQVTGSFKPRGALNVALNLPEEVRQRGFTTFSSGNHAAAVAYAARVLGTTAKVVMVRTANPARIANCARHEAEMMLAPDVAEAASMARAICETEGRTFIHPFEGPLTSCGISTLGLELHRQVPDLDAVLIAIGGGGLCSGVASALKQLRPQCAVLAVEPQGADTMYRSFESGRPETLTAVRTIADSLAPPHALPYSYGLCRRTVDRLELLTDEQIRRAMACLHQEFKLVVEPGGAAATAGALYPYREQIAGKRVAILVCGSNIDLDTFAKLAA